jgi:hypothetical protein
MLIDRDYVASRLYDAASQIGRDDPDFLGCDFEAFCRVMWTDDSDMKRYFMSRDEYRAALREAWEWINDR